MIGICSRCNREERIENRKKNLCMVCCNSLRQHKRHIEGRIPEEQREKKKIYFRKYYAKNKERLLRNMKKYYVKHSDRMKHNARTRLQYHKLLLFSKVKKICKICGSKKNLEMHHKDYKWENISFKKKNQRDMILNSNLDRIEILCRCCHRKKHRLYPI